MKESRIDYIASMYSYIMKVPKDEALRVIISTPTGKAISQNNSTYLYDQPTSNLSAIVAELPREIQPNFSKRNIIHAANIAYYSAPRKVAAAPGLKSVQKARLKHLNSIKLQKHSSSRATTKGATR